MGIGNLGNNFGKSTAKTPINNKVNNGKLNAAKLAKTEKSDIKSSLNSAILKDGEGEKFDSSSIFNEPGIVCAYARKSLRDCINEGIKKRGEMHKDYVAQGGGATGVALAGVVDGIINYFRQ